MSDMREAGKRKVETQLPHLWNPHKIKKSDKMKLRYKISIWVVLALAGSLLCGGSVWLGWQGYVQENSSFDYSLPSLWLSQCTF